MRHLPSITVYQPGEIIWTLSTGGKPRAWKVEDAGRLQEMKLEEALERTVEAPAFDTPKSGRTL